MKHLIVLTAMVLPQWGMAESLCAGGCQMTAEFVEGGSLEAVEVLQITFGQGGVINDGASATGYAAGEILTLNAGDRLDFAAGGILDLGADGDIDYSAMNLTVNGNLQISAAPDVMVSLHGDSIFRINGDLTLDSSWSLEATLDLSGATTTASGNGELTLQPSAVIQGSTGQLTMTGGSPGTITAGNLAALDGGDLNLISGAIQTSGVIQIGEASLVTTSVQGANMVEVNTPLQGASKNRAFANRDIDNAIALTGFYYHFGQIRFLRSLFPSFLFPFSLYPAK